MIAEPVPFHLKLSGSDTLGFRGARSVSYRVDGLLHFDGTVLTLEWATTRHVEQVSFGRVRVNDQATAPTLLDLPIDWLAEARYIRGWWKIRIVLRARRLDAFDDVPGAGPGTVTLRIARRHRPLASAMVRALASARTLPPPATAHDLPAMRPELRRGEPKGEVSDSYLL